MSKIYNKALVLGGSKGLGKSIATELKKVVKLLMLFHQKILILHI